MRGAERCGLRHPSAAGARRFHQRGRLALSAVRDGQLGLCRRSCARGRLRDPRDRWTEGGERVQRIGYAGSAQPGWLRPHAYLELHIEQGPILEDENCTIGAVEGITGLTWTEVTVTGCSGHAGTTPMHLRHDAALVSGEIIALVHRLAQKIGGHQKGTVGRIELYPNQIGRASCRERGEMSV